MAKSDAQKERDERIAKRNELINRKVEQAKMPDARVFSLKTDDVVTAVNLLSQTDIAMSRLRRQIGGRIEADIALKLIAGFELILLDIEKFTQNVCEVTGSRYIRPKVLTAIEKKHVPEE